MPYRLIDLMEGARNLVISHGCVKKGGNVCIYVATTSDPLVTEAIACAVEEAGAEPVIVTSRPIDDPKGSVASLTHLLR